ncbi:bud neck involved protein [Parahypoxylon ruwenzoriense]
MAALVQAYPQQSGTVTLLQTRPNSSSAIMPGPSGTQPNQAYMANSQRNGYHGVSGGSIGGPTVYRGNTTAPVQPYAFTATPSLANGGQWQQYGAYRSSNIPTMQMADPNSMAARPRYASNSPSTSGNNSNAQSTMAVGISQDDSRIMSTSAPRPQLAPLNISPNQPTFAQVAAAKASPERYRRPSPRYTDSSPGVMQTPQPQGSAIPSGSGMATVVHLYNPRAMPDQKARMVRSSAAVANRPHSAYGSMAMDDMHLHRHGPEQETKRFRRRSIHSINSTDYPKPLTPQEFKQAEESFRLEALAASKKQGGSDKDQRSGVRAGSFSSAVPVEKNAVHAVNGSSESLVSSGSSNSRPSSSANRNSNASAPTVSPASTSSTSGDRKSGQDQPKPVSIPPRGSSTDGKRALNPSPLSKPATMAPGSSSDDSAKPTSAPESSSTKPPAASASHSSVTDSPAAKQLAAINEKGGKSKNKTSRLRRAFSFGSAAELRKAAGQDVTSNTGKTAQGESARLHKEPTAEDLYEEEQARIAQKQEEGGIGSSIYSGTKLFSGSTDNLSVSSTASSASIMLRKMGRGMKKGGRSLVGLFRPKSVIGAPGEDSKLPEASQAAVSMVTVEAERDRVNVKADSHGQQAGGARMENSSVNVSSAVDSVQPDRLGSSSTDNSNARKSIIGGEKERAEVLATIRKGILKSRSEVQSYQSFASNRVLARSNSPSPSARGADAKGPAFDLPTIPNVSNSPSSSAPSTPNEDTPSHKRRESVTIGNEDYFVSALRLRQDTKSAPTTPQGTSGKRCATFSPRIVFYDTWPSGEYDRRGDIATCNRLTPMLAQQIKEELNSFKMEMEVHETSKIYTHFF